jgi:hypothetical protein
MRFRQSKPEARAKAEVFEATEPSLALQARMTGACGWSRTVLFRGLATPHHDRTLTPVPARLF